MEIGLIIYPHMTQLDISSPHQVFSLIPDVKIHFLWKDTNPVTSDGGLTVIPTTSFAESPSLDIICVPGGPGQIAMMQDEEMLNFYKSRVKLLNL